MAYHKVVKQQIMQDPTSHHSLWGNFFPDFVQIDYALLEKIFVDNPDSLIMRNWNDSIKKINPCLTIKFKDIYFGKLNQLIADYFQTALLPEVDDFIIEYRQVNQKYFD
jgi:hypothetical protein